MKHTVAAKEDSVTRWGCLVPGPKLSSVGLVSSLKTVLHFFKHLPLNEEAIVS